MKPDKKQLPRLIILGVLVLACVGYVSFKVISPSTPAPEAVKPEKDAAGATATVVVDTSAARVLSGSGTPLARRDPFMPQALPPAENDESQTVNVTRRTKPVSIIPTSKGRLPKINIGPFNPFAGNTGPSSVGALPISTRPEHTYTLTGVVRGEENVVIVRSGDNARHIVKQGQLIDGRYRVLAVTEDGAVLANGNRRMYMKLGGVKNER